MIIVFVEGSGQMGQRFDDPEAMGKYIASVLEKSPLARIRIQKYV